MYDYRRVDDFIERAKLIADSHNKDEAFQIIAAEIESCEDRYLNDFISALNFLRDERALDWIEQNVNRILNVSLNWGHVAASSFFSWHRADKWLAMGRPLSLIALDAIDFCTTVGERLNQSLWMREIQPKLVDNPRPEIVAKRLQEYLSRDKAPRVRFIVEAIISNVFDTRQ